MNNLIMLDMENLENEFQFLLKCFVESQGFTLKNSYVIDSVEFGWEGVKEPYNDYTLFFNTNEHKPHINAQTGEEMEYTIGIEKVHQQYNFETNKLYGFFYVNSNSVCEVLNTRDFEEFMSKKSRIGRKMDSGEF